MLSFPSGERSQVNKWVAIICMYLCIIGKSHHRKETPHSTPRGNLHIGRRHIMVLGALAALCHHCGTLSSMYSVAIIILKSGQPCLPESERHKTEASYHSLVGREGHQTLTWDYSSSPISAACNAAQLCIGSCSTSRCTQSASQGCLYPRIAMIVVQFDVTMDKD